MKVKLMAPLANVDDSIVGFEITSEVLVTKYNVEKIIELLHPKKYVKPVELGYLWDSALLDLKSDDIYVLEGTFKFPDINMGDSIAPSMELLWDMHNRSEAIREKIYAISGEIREKMGLLDLFYDSQVDAPKHYFNTERGAHFTLNITTGEYRKIERRVAHIPSEHLPNVRKYLWEVSMGEKKEYLQIAFSYFRDSYLQEDPRIVMLQLMMAVEAIFNMGESDIAYIISRGMSVLLGDSIDESREIYRMMKKMYRARSGIIHGGSASELDSAKIEHLRKYLKKCLRFLIHLDLKKETLYDGITESGYGEYYKTAKDRFPYNLNDLGSADNASGN